MNDIFKKIDAAKHIELFVKPQELFVGSVLYSYILTLHKKVSLVCKNERIEHKFSCLPWFEKIKITETPSADLRLIVDYSFAEVYQYFKNSDIKINKKMATAFYGALLFETDGFLNVKTDGTSFALANELIALGAEYKMCKYFILEHCTLGQLRLKSLMLEKMVLINDATVALFVIDKNDLKSTRTLIEDALLIIKEGFRLEYVQSVILLSSDDQHNVIKIINKECNT